MAQKLSGLGIDVATRIWHVLGMHETGVVVFGVRHPCLFCTGMSARSLSTCAILCVSTLRPISNVDRWMSKHDARACWLSFPVPV